MPFHPNIERIPSENSKLPQYLIWFYKFCPETFSDIFFIHLLVTLTLAAKIEGTERDRDYDRELVHRHQDAQPSQERGGRKGA